MKDFKPGDIVYYATYNGVGTAKLQKCMVERVFDVGMIPFSEPPFLMANLYVLQVIIGEGKAGIPELASVHWLSPTLKDGISGLIESIERERQSILASIEVLQEQCEALEKEKAFVAMFEDEKELING